jgi:hypothetical protein
MDGVRKLLPMIAYPLGLAFSNGIRDAKNSTSQTVAVDDKRAPILINQQQNCCWLVTIHSKVGQILPD